MTGEVTLTGRVLPVGGVREKILAARRAGIKIVLLPRHNEKDLVDIPAEVKADLTSDWSIRSTTSSPASSRPAPAQTSTQPAAPRTSRLRASDRRQARRRPQEGPTGPRSQVDPRRRGRLDLALGGASDRVRLRDAAFSLLGLAGRLSAYGSGAGSA